MADEEYLALLRQGADIWNKWRSNNIREGDCTILDLSKANLSWADLRWANLIGVDLSGANLAGADLRWANLSGANLSGANLSKTNLSRFDLSGANLSGANLSGAKLEGADLRWANLSGAILDKASLINTNLTDANLNHAVLFETNLSYSNFYRANLTFAVLSEVSLFQTNLSESNLSYANLRNIDISGANINFEEEEEYPHRYPYGDLAMPNLKNAKLIRVDLYNANIKFANLSNLDLAYACLADADLSYSNFSGSNLSGANLIKTRALGVDFTGAKLTGACLDDWHINSTTKLDDIHCQYVYLKDNERERRPSSGEFAPGEFTKLFQKALETIDLIFADGIDWKAFLLSLQELKAEYGEDNLSVQAIEKKSGGAFVIRLEVSSEVDKAAIESNAKLLYEQKLRVLEENYRNQLQDKDREIIDIYRQHNTRFDNIINNLALAQAKPNHIEIHNYNKAESTSMSESYQSKYDQRNANNQFVDTAQSGSNVTFNQQNYTPEQKQNLAEAAAEIQQLLYQLAQTNPTSTEGFTEAIHQEIKRNPTLKARLQGALKAGGLEALKAIFNHPLFSIPAETVKGWLEAE
ncbi:hypothetical protein NIES2101_13490 [Calothrix sp. HK-06]|nr:hypothetical protein NIES2101_13490 [Calothrix sp. HK-06]